MAVDPEGGGGRREWIEKNKKQDKYDAQKKCIRKENTIIFGMAIQ